MTDVTRQYILNQQQGIDNYWLTDYIKDGTFYELVFTDKFKLWCVNIMTADADNVYSIHKTLSDSDSKKIYKDFAKSIT